MSMKSVKISSVVSKYLVLNDIQEEFLRNPTLEGLNYAYLYGYFSEEGWEAIKEILMLVKNGRHHDLVSRIYQSRSLSWKDKDLLLSGLGLLKNLS